MMNRECVFQIAEDVRLCASLRDLFCEFSWEPCECRMMFNFKKTGLCDTKRVYFYPDYPMYRDMPINRIVDHIINKALTYFNFDKCKEAENMTPTEYFKMDAEFTKKIINSVYGSPFRKALYIKKVIFNPPATIVFWSDGTKTVVKAQNDEPFDPEKGITMAITKKFFGNKGKYFNEIKKWTEPYYASSDSK